MTPEERKVWERAQREQEMLLWVTKAGKEIQSGTLSKRTTRNKVERRKGHRLVSPRQRAAMQMSPHVYKEETIEKIRAQWSRINGPEGDLTRNVGPSDLDQNYQHGKNTGPLRGY